MRAADVESAVRRQRDARHRSPGMRDRLRSSEHDSRLLVADVRTSASAANAAVEACRLRVLASEQRLAEVREIVDGLAGNDASLLTSIRQAPTLPPNVQRFPTIPAFIADLGARAIGDPRLQDLAGRPIGERWSLEEIATPWVTTRWKVLWSCAGEAPLDEVFAVEQAARPRAARRVVLLGNASLTPSFAHQIERIISRQGERNSLAALAAVVAG